MRDNRRPGHACERVRRALTRLSRDRWLSPREVIETSIALAFCCSFNPRWTASHSYPYTCQFVGMVRGEPPLHHWQPYYRELLAAVKKLTPAKAKRNAIELEILKLTLKGISHGR